MKPIMTFFPETRLAKLAARFGGIARDDAVEAAKKCLDAMRGEGGEAIERAMAEIEKIMESAQNGRLAKDKMNAILRTADQVVTLAGTFDFEAFGRVMKSLCDVADGLIRTGTDDAAPIAVHVRAMRLLAPGKSTLNEEEIETILSELLKVAKHYDFAPIAGQAAGVDESFPGAR